MERTPFLHIAAAVLACGALGSGAAAQAPLIGSLGGTAGYGPDGQCLSRNDDGSSAAIDITPYFPGGLRFFDRTHTTVYVNTNGNITFDEPVSTYTPDAFPIADQPMIAPYWADVDIRKYPARSGSCDGADGVTCEVCEPCHNPTENGVWWFLEPGRMIVTWDRVGRYRCKNGERMAFQLVLTAVSETCGGTGDFDVEFRFNQCEWEVGDASGDANGNGMCEDGEEIDFGFPPGRRLVCTPAQSGFDAGNRVDYVSIMGSMMPGIGAALCSGSNVGETGIWRFQIRSGTVMCPDAGDACDTGMQGVCAAGRTNCVGSGTECVQDVEASPERCDALDNDCDGMVDESPETLCGEGLLCVGGTCLAPCFERGCMEGQVCLPSGQCIDAACEGVTCPEGERCDSGACVGACEGITCPAGTSCRAGRCVDLCEGLACDDCTVCEDGVCVPRCMFVDCAAGESCQEDGRCIETACVGVACDPGSFCRAGACVDACEGAVCPPDQECRTGACVPRAVTDGGVPPGRDGSVPRTDGGAEADGGVARLDGAPGGGPPDDGGCGCRIAGAPAPASPFALAMLAVLAALAFRRVR